MKVLGRSDRIDLPELRLKNIHAKIDTGAYTSSLHCHSAEVVNETLRVVLLSEGHSGSRKRTFSFDTFEKKAIKNSFGEVEERFVITTTLRIFNEDITTQVSLSNRGSLKFPILLGRKILRDRFLIDVKKKNLSYREKRASRVSSKETKS